MGIFERGHIEGCKMYPFMKNCNTYRQFQMSIRNAVSHVWIKIQCQGHYMKLCLYIHNLVVISQHFYKLLQFLQFKNYSSYAIRMKTDPLLRYMFVVLYTGCLIFCYKLYKSSTE